MGFQGSNFEPGMVPESGTLAGPGSYVGLNADGDFILTSSAGGGGDGTPGGSDTQIQFNDGGSFNGTTNLTVAGTVASASADFLVKDDTKLIFGNDKDAEIEYDEGTTNKLIISGSVTGLEIKGNSISVDFPGGTVSSGSLGGDGSYLGLDSSHNIILTSAAGGGGTPAGSDTQIQIVTGKQLKYCYP